MCWRIYSRNRYTTCPHPLTGSPRSRHLHVQLDSVDAEYIVTDVAEHVARADHPTPHGQLADLEELRFPGHGVAEVNVGAKLDDAMTLFTV